MNKSADVVGGHEIRNERREAKTKNNPMRMDWNWSVRSTPGFSIMNVTGILPTDIYRKVFLNSVHCRSL